MMRKMGWLTRDKLRLAPDTFSPFAFSFLVSRLNAAVADITFDVGEYCDGVE
jgi:hypothetical protein